MKRSALFVVDENFVCLSFENIEKSFNLLDLVRSLMHRPHLVVQLFAFRHERVHALEDDERTNG